jgi:hypothetical protein
LTSGSRQAERHAGREGSPGNPSCTPVRRESRSSRTHTRCLQIVSHTDRDADTQRHRDRLVHSTMLHSTSHTPILRCTRQDKTTQHKTRQDMTIHSTPHTAHHTTPHHTTRTVVRDARPCDLLSAAQHQRRRGRHASPGRRYVENLRLQACSSQPLRYNCTTAAAQL